MTALDFAIEMELDGQRYYLDEANRNEANSVKRVCLLLAKDEETHAQILTSKKNALPYHLTDHDSYLQLKNIFSEITQFRSDIRETPTQLEFYRVALGKEKESIALYTDLLSKAEDENERELFRYLIEQETVHHSLLDQIATELRHAEEWVESAEFGLRTEEY